MEAIKRKVKSGAEYDHLFPRAKRTTQVAKRDAQVSHTMNFIPKVVMQTLHHTDKIAKELEGENTYETCKNIWHWVYDHITYQKDAHGLEQVRSPARAWADRHDGVDCDCYTTFISSILTNLRIPHIYRITKYKSDNWQHIYPIVPTGNGSYITVDCVVKRFNYEEPYSQKQDKYMELQYLNGIDDETFNDLLNDELGDLGEMGALFKKKNKSTSPGTEQKKGFLKKIGTSIKKVAHVVNRVNPATVLLRNGVLASMKLNIMKVAGNLKWAYLTPEQAKAKGILPEKHQKLKQVMQKLEQIFFSAGGKPENLKKAILTGKGNAKKQVPLAGFDHIVYGIDEFGEVHNEYTPLATLLGHDIYHSENVEGMEGLGQLGEPVTGAAIAAASGALASIAAIIKGIGGIFPKGSKEDDGGGESGSANETVDVDTSGQDSGGSNLPAARTTNETDAGSDSGSGDGDAPKEGFWEKNKSWIKPVGFVAGGATAIYLISKAMKSNKTVSGVEGIPDKKPPKRTTKKTPAKAKGKSKKTPVALM